MCLLLKPNAATVPNNTDPKVANLLRRENKKYALSTQCIGLGMGIATIIETVD